MNPVQTILMHSTGDIFDALADTPVHSYEDDLENASEDELRAWLLGNDVAEEEITLRELGGYSLRDLCEELILSGYAFRSN